MSPALAAGRPESPGWRPPRGPLWFPEGDGRRPAAGGRAAGCRGRPRAHGPRPPWGTPSPKRWPAPSCDKPHRPGAATRRHSAACRRARAFRRPGRGIGAPAARERRAATPGGRRPARRAATPGGRRAGRGVPGAATGARASAARGEPEPEALQLSSGGRNSVAALRPQRGAFCCKRSSPVTYAPARSLPAPDRPPQPPRLPNRPHSPTPPAHTPPKPHSPADRSNAPKPPAPRPPTRPSTQSPTTRVERHQPPTTNHHHQPTAPPGPPAPPYPSALIVSTPPRRWGWRLGRRAGSLTGAACMARRRTSRQDMPSLSSAGMPIRIAVVTSTACRMTP
jgi:hypothetical protein